MPTTHHGIHRSTFRIMENFLTKSSIKKNFLTKSSIKNFLIRKRIRNQKSEIRNQKSEIRNQKSEIRNQKSEIRNQKSEIRNQKSEIRNQKSEIRNQKSDGGLGWARAQAHVYTLSLLLYVGNFPLMEKCPKICIIRFYLPTSVYRKKPKWPRGRTVPSPWHFCSGRRPPGLF